MNKKGIILTGLVLAVLIISLVLTFGCAQKSPTSPYIPNIPTTSNISTPQANSVAQSSDKFKVLCESDFTIDYNTLTDLAKLVEVYLTCDSSRLVFPAFSVPSLVSITGSVKQGLDFREGLVTYMNCFPDGLTFLKPVEFHYRSSTADGSEIKFYWYDPDKGIWCLQQTEKVANGEVVFEIKHFSKYKVVDGSTSNGSERY